mmetsp:Transcript_785/g.2280  ORF Transcript_785/g.2280 Transcript_785/m.2280 type:complete len:150 (-) Transcript_785:303-752(-)|eukprot:CAMPEP_0113591192 /NCGR_PEP_ID=MMETSP0015_2-20120614/37126_1 /TAXON_ID=2838 /ORGANISM="Odontella" /LENGTH=149 /DNA_ID=CAMNT_0000497533 /DNA_START=16 /DNA_END=465 /DNA_ORIENTATION=+ /assembly_acc=CAM_ASM_000160
MSGYQSQSYYQSAASPRLVSNADDEFVATILRTLQSIFEKERRCDRASYSRERNSSLERLPSTIDLDTSHNQSLSSECNSEPDKMFLGRSYLAPTNSSIQPTVKPQVNSSGGLVTKGDPRSGTRHCLLKYNSDPCKGCVANKQNAKRAD